MSDPHLRLEKESATPSYRILAEYTDRQLQVVLDIVVEYLPIFRERNGNDTFLLPLLAQI